VAPPRPAEPQMTNKKQKSTAAKFQTSTSA
jgi:hypothetical protein